MMNNFVFRRLLQLGAFFLIGDGIMGLLQPRRHSLLWRYGPPLARASAEELADHPKTARAYYFAEMVIGLVLACLQRDAE